MWGWLPEGAEARPLGKRAYQARESQLRRDLLQAQGALRRAPFSALVLVAGVDGAGKGDTVNLLNEWLDPRWIRTRAFDRPSDEERERPRFWRFWRALPPHGELALFLSAWYSEPLLGRVLDRSAEWLAQELESVTRLEKTLVEGGTLIVKLWLHLSREAQERRFRSLEADPLQRWRVSDRDWRHLSLYDRFVSASEEILEQTHTPQCPWQVIDGSDPRRRSIEVGDVLLRSLRSRLQEQIEREPPPAPHGPRSKPIGARPEASAGSAVPKDGYRQELAKLQGELNLLHRRARSLEIPFVAVFEGRDGAGKGGCIRRVVPAFDARCVEVVRVGPPTQEERAHHYLWRFWRDLPRSGLVTLFDRSWYGRVLVERVEGLIEPERWEQAYGEIVDFERQLVQHGTAVAKIWLEIDKKEQARRFEARLRTAHKRWKLSEDDWRNRGNWKHYSVAIADMLDRTHTDAVPWHVVPANDKRYARLEVLRILCRALGDRVSRGSTGAGQD